MNILRLQFYLSPDPNGLRVEMINPPDHPINMTHCIASRVQVTPYTTLYLKTQVLVSNTEIINRDSILRVSSKYRKPLPIIGIAIRMVHIAPIWNIKRERRDHVYNEHNETA